MHVFLYFKKTIQFKNYAILIDFKLETGPWNEEEQTNATYQKTFGHFDIHREFAHNFWAESNFVQARYHFLHSQDGASCAKMLIDCHLNYGYPSEIDLFLTQTVLQFLCLRNLRTAREFHDTYVKLHPGFAAMTKTQQPSEIGNLVQRSVVA